MPLARVYPHLIIRVSRSLDPGEANFLFAQVYRPKHREQKPTFRLFGTPEKNKRHVLLETAHYALTARTQVLCEVLRWLDKSLGPVQ